MQVAEGDATVAQFRMKQQMQHAEEISTPDHVLVANVVHVWEWWRQFYTPYDRDMREVHAAQCGLQGKRLSSMTQVTEPPREWCSPLEFKSM